MCDWDWSDAPPNCSDYRKDATHYDVIPANEHGFGRIKNRLCILRLPHGRVFRGRPVAMDGDNGVFVRLDQEAEEFLVVEMGTPVEIYPLE